MSNAGPTSDLAYYQLSELQHGELAGVAQVHRPDKLRLVHEADEPLDQVVDVAERTRLHSFSVDGKILASQGLDHEIRNHSPIVCQHPRAVSVENPYHPDIDAVFPMVVKKQSFRAAFAFVIARAQPDRIYVPPITFRLRMDLRIPVNLGRRGLKDTSLDPLREAEAIDGAHHRGLCRLDRIELVVRRGSWASQIVDLVDLDLERINDIMPDQLKPGIVHQMLDVRFAAGKKVIQADHIVIRSDQPLAKMGAKKPGSTGNKNFHKIIRLANNTGR